MEDKYLLRIAIALLYSFTASAAATSTAFSKSVTSFGKGSGCLLIRTGSLGLAVGGFVAGDASLAALAVT